MMAQSILRRRAAVGAANGGTQESADVCTADAAADSGRRSKKMTLNFFALSTVGDNAILSKVTVAEQRRE